MKAQPLDDGILFVFLDVTYGGMFEDRSEMGIILGRSHQTSAQHGRWGKVVAVGPKVKDEGIKPGSNVFIEPLMWTKGIVYDGVEIWKTDETKILAVEE